MLSAYAAKHRPVDTDQDLLSKGVRKMRTVGYKGWARWTMVAAAAAMVVGCGDDPVPAVVLPAGAVVQGPVKDAIIFADEVVANGRGNGVLDAKEKAFSTKTDVNGDWKLTAVPTYDYEMVSIGGTDTLTDQPAMTMRAEGGKANQTVTTKNVTPLTTLVQLSEPAKRDAMKQTIQSLGVKFDQKIDDGITPAAAALVKAVTTTATQVVAVLNAAAGGSADDNRQAISTTAVKAVQTELLTKLAEEIAGKTADDLDSGAKIAAVTQTATNAALIQISSSSSNSGGLTFNTTPGDLQNLSAAIANTVNILVTDIANAPGNNGSLSTETVKPEAEVIAAALTTIQNSTTDNSVESVFSTVVIQVQAPVNTPPTITGASPASGSVGVAFTYTPTVADPDSSDILTLSITGSKPIPPGLTFNPTTGVISGTPTAFGTGTYTISVSDGVASASPPLTVTLTFTQVTGATGATGF